MGYVFVGGEIVRRRNFFYLGDVIKESLSKVRKYVVYRFFVVELDYRVRGFDDGYTYFLVLVGDGLY